MSTDSPVHGGLQLPQQLKSAAIMPVPWWWVSMSDWQMRKQLPQLPFGLAGPS
jgi:hypothetical protein